MADYDLALKNPEAVDRDEIDALVAATCAVSNRALTLNGKAVDAWRKWLADPSQALKSEAFVLTSNWFLSPGNDTSPLARACELLWDKVFACRPKVRLSSSAAGRNHKVVPGAFDAFWVDLVEAQGGKEPLTPAPMAKAVNGSDAGLEKEHDEGGDVSTLQVNQGKCSAHTQTPNHQAILAWTGSPQFSASGQSQ
jgi:hypothetical protein